VRLAGYDADGGEITDADVLSADELAADYGRLRRREGGRHTFKVPKDVRPRSGHAAYDDPRVDEFGPERERRADR
jgi:hypothetical protein